MPMITCNGLSFAYEGKTVLRDLSFQVEQGDYVAIVGENGAGKSTLVKGIVGLKTPKSGEITFGGQMGRRDIGYLSQQTAVQQFPASVEEIVRSGTLARRGLRPLYRREEKERARREMEALGIIGLRGRSYQELSGGQQQRVLLARALCAAERLLVLDEPVSSLDPAAEAELYDLISKRNREAGLTVLMVSHDVGKAVRTCSHILHIGRDTSFFGDTEVYIASPVGHAFLKGERQ